MNANEMRRVLDDCSFSGWIFRLGTETDHRPFLQVMASDACARTGAPITWHGRKWRLSQYMTRSELVQTALHAVLTATEHEARERFLYKGQPIFGPHYDVDRLKELCEAGGFDERKQA